MATRFWGRHTSSVLRGCSLEEGEVARPGAEIVNRVFPSAAGFRIDERVAAVAARNFEPTGAEPVRQHHRGLIRADEERRLPLCAVHVTGVTGRDDVLRPVVVDVLVDVVRDDRSGVLRLLRVPDDPVERRPAPVAGMGAGTNPVVQHLPVNLDFPSCRACEWMPRRSDSPVVRLLRRRCVHTVMVSRRYRKVKP
jgi:hypothetical protein